MESIAWTARSALGLGHALGFEDELDVLLDGPPGHQRERLEDHRHPWIRPGERGFPGTRRCPTTGRSARRQRSRVGCPKPDLPSSATISPSARVKLTPSSTGRAQPSERGERLGDRFDGDDYRAFVRHCLAGHRGTSWRSAPQRVPPFCERVQQAPQQPVDEDHVDAHREMPTRTCRKFPVAVGVGDVRARRGPSGGGCRRRRPRRRWRRSTRPCGSEVIPPVT